jgi:hypothetical protein
MRVADCPGATPAGLAVNATITGAEPVAVVAGMPGKQALISNKNGIIINSFFITFSLPFI